MKRTKIILVIIGLMLVVSGAIMGENGIQVDSYGDAINVRVEGSFVSGLFQEPSTIVSSKQQLLSTLDRLSVDYKKPFNLLEGFNLLHHTKLLTLAEKIEWLKARADILIPPYLLLLGGYLIMQPGSFEEGFKWWNAANFNVTYDIKKCKDKSVAGAAEGMLFAFQALDLSSIVDGKEHIMENLVKQVPAFLKAHPSKVSEYPYWLAISGMSAISAKLHDSQLLEEQMFVNKSKWSEIRLEGLNVLTEAYR